MLVQEISDPRLAGVSVTDVTVDREMAYADVYFSALDRFQRSNRFLEVRMLRVIFDVSCQRIELRVFPRLRFHWDPTLSVPSTSKS
jgi:ribosome-binding factor A